MKENAGFGEQNVSTDLTFRTSFNRRRAAYWVRPETGSNLPAILYLHWYEPEACDSHRGQFLAEAQTMARRGVMSLLVETVWSDREWFIKRTQADDLRTLSEQSAEVRQALDILLDRPGVDPTRAALVGHDFGAMFGVLAGALDPRPTAYVLAAGTPRWADWFLYYPHIEGIERDEFITSMKPHDPIERVSDLSPAPILFQFATEDPHVPRDRALAFFEAAASAELRWYEAGHGLNDRAKEDRIEWLSSLWALGNSASRSC